MREFKFRCFDKMEGYMLSWQDLLDGGDLEEMMKLGHEEDENYSRLMQYTGLKDKNGVEIYEGDVVHKNYNNNLTATGEVIYDSATYFIREVEGHSFLYGGYEGEEIEVISNIHENP